MKIWNNHGSEHSMNLVMIGRFKSAADATNAKEVIDQIAEQVGNDDQSIAESDRYSDGMLALLGKLKIHSIGPRELEQFRYDVGVDAKNSEVILRTDEVD